jgi:hypothetical protein
MGFAFSCVQSYFSLALYHRVCPCVSPLGGYFCRKNLYSVIFFLMSSGIYLHRLIFLQINISQTFRKNFKKLARLEYSHKSKIKETKIMSKFVKANEKIARKVVDGYKKIEGGVVDGYKKIENGAVEGFGKVVDKCVEVLFTRDDESVEDAKARLSGKDKE